MSWQIVAVVGEVFLFLLSGAAIKAWQQNNSYKSFIAAAGNPLLNMENVMDQIKRVGEESE